ncbi:hypothetical protein GF386_03465 [Candidatus Pacearchaeota archaeon]|nr:hypothetical protein [Candidatus Pacearchaeota archaeon]MBD3283200.1 hypothetical protein [Candidatus Pacearchaeota archaeon]
MQEQLLDCYNCGNWFFLRRETEDLIPVHEDERCRRILRYRTSLQGKKVRLRRFLHQRGYLNDEDEYIGCNNWTVAAGEYFLVKFFRHIRKHYNYQRIEDLDSKIPGEVLEAGNFRIQYRHNRIGLDVYQGHEHLFGLSKLVRITNNNRKTLVLCRLATEPEIPEPESVSSQKRISSELFPGNNQTMYMIAYPLDFFGKQIHDRKKRKQVLGFLEDPKNRILVYSTPSDELQRVIPDLLRQPQHQSA